MELQPNYLTIGCDDFENKKTLEQVSTLDKIRAEIAAYGSIWVEYSIPGYTEHDIEVIVNNVLKQAKEQVLKVIDKYKTESEGKE